MTILKQQNSMRPNVIRYLAFYFFSRSNLLQLISSTDDTIGGFGMRWWWLCTIFSYNVKYRHEQVTRLVVSETPTHNSATQSFRSQNYEE